MIIFIMCMTDTLLLLGPFGGSVAFTQSAAAKKRAIEYNLRKRHFTRGTLGKL